MDLGAGLVDPWFALGAIRVRRTGATPFVDVGTRVDPETVVCLIEVMKMMNAVPAGVSGTIVEVCAENAAVVEFGAPLFQVEPDA